jgi:hypothetical protein
MAREPMMHSPKSPRTDLADSRLIDRAKQNSIPLHGTNVYFSLKPQSHRMDVNCDPNRAPKLLKRLT